MTAPFEPPADPVQVAKQYNLVQLEGEIREAVGNPDLNFAVTGPDDWNSPIGADNPSTLWIQPTGVDVAVVEQVISAHQVNPNWGVPAAVLAYQDVVTKILADPETSLSDAEQRALLVGLVLRSQSPTP